MSEFRVDEIVNCAGCVDYFDQAGLQKANVDLVATFWQQLSAIR